MKRIVKYLILPCLLLVGFVSCEDEDKDPLAPYNELVKGAFFRTIENGGTINRTDVASSSYFVTGEVVSDNDNSDIDVSNVQMWVEFVDRTKDDDPNTPDDDSVEPTLFETADISIFSTNENSLPQYTFNVGISDAIDALGLDLNSVEGGDQFLFKIAISMSDGTVFNTDNTGDSVKGELFFASPMVYTGLVICILDTPPSGDWRITMQDSYGDGWQGSAVVTTIDGVDQSSSLPDFWTAGLGGAVGDALYSDGEVLVNVPSGTSTLTFSWVSGDYPSEATFEIYAPSGNLVATGGPSPEVGEIALNLCNE